MSTELQPSRVDPLSNMLTLAASMVEKGTDPIALKQTLDLVESFRRARAAEAYAFDMAACQGEMPAVFRSEKNNFTGSTYAPFEDINKYAKPIYTKHGFSLMFSEEPCQTPGMARIGVDVRHSAGHKEHIWCELPIDGEGAKGGKPSMNAVQGKVSTVSGYGRRTLLKLAFAISETGDDQDGNHGTERATETEIKYIGELVKDTKSDWLKFTAWLKQAVGAEKLEDIPKSEVAKVIDMLERKKAKATNGHKPEAKPEPHYEADPYHQQAPPVDPTFGPEPMDIPY